MTTKPADERPPYGNGKPGWVWGRDGMGPEHVDADPKCKTCGGHGILDDGLYATLWVECACVVEGNAQRGRFFPDQA